MENMVQTQCGCREPTNTYFFFFFFGGGGGGCWRQNEKCNLQEAVHHKGKGHPSKAHFSS